MRATSLETKAPGGGKVKRERVRCSVLLRSVLQGGYSEDRDKETEGQGPRGLGKWAREDEGERTHEGQS